MIEMAIASGTGIVERIDKVSDEFRFAAFRDGSIEIRSSAPFTAYSAGCAVSANGRVRCIYDEMAEAGPAEMTSNAAAYIVRIPRGAVRPDSLAVLEAMRRAA